MEYKFQPRFDCNRRIETGKLTDKYMSKKLKIKSENKCLDSVKHTREKMYHLFGIDLSGNTNIKKKTCG